MRKKPTPLEIARRHAAELPAFASQAEASDWYYALLARKQERLASLMKALKGPAPLPTQIGLRDMEVFVWHLSAAKATAVGTSLGELDNLLHWHMGAAVVASHPHAEWVVVESDVLPSRWEMGVRLGLRTDFMAPEPLTPGQYGTPRRGRHPSAPHAEKLVYVLRNSGSDPLLHPRVLANLGRLSTDCTLQHCQVLALAHDIDIFSERALRAMLKRPRHEDFILALRCLEAHERLSDTTISLLVRYADKPSSRHDMSALAMVIQHRPALGLRLATRLRGRFGRVGSCPVVEAIALHAGPEWCDVLSTIIDKMTETEATIWQEREGLATAARLLLEHAEAGHAAARRGMAIIARRWRRIPPDAMPTIRRLVPGLTRAAALAAARG